MSDCTNGENVHREIENIEYLVKIKGISDMRSTIALDPTRSTIGNSKGGMGGCKVI